MELLNRNKKRPQWGGLELLIYYYFNLFASYLDIILTSKNLYKLFISNKINYLK